MGEVLSELARIGATAAPSQPARDKAFWERLFVRMERRCLALAWRISSDAHLAEDAVQEGFLRAFRAQELLRPDTDVERWLLAIVANAARDMVRSRRRDLPSDTEAPPPQLGRDLAASRV